MKDVHLDWQPNVHAIQMLCTGPGVVCNLVFPFQHCLPAAQMSAPDAALVGLKNDALCRVFY